MPGNRDALVRPLNVSDVFRKMIACVTQWNSRHWTSIAKSIAK